MVWLSQHPAWGKARKVAVSTSSFGLESRVDCFDGPKNGRKVRFVVAYDYESTFWHKRRYIKVIRSKAEGISYHATRSLHIRYGRGSTSEFASELNCPTVSLGVATNSLRNSSLRPGNVGKRRDKSRFQSTLPTRGTNGASSPLVPNVPSDPSFSTLA